MLAAMLRGGVSRLVIAAALLAGCGREAFGPRDAEAIQGVLDAQRAAWNAGDIERFMEGYHRRSDVVFTSGAKIRRGWDATLESYRARYVEGDHAMGTLEFADLEIQGLGPDAAVVLGHWSLTGTPEAGAGVFSLVFTQEDGRWAIVHDHTSAGPGS